MASFIRPAECDGRPVSASDCLPHQVRHEELQAGLGDWVAQARARKDGGAAHVEPCQPREPAEEQYPSGVIHRWGQDCRGRCDEMTPLLMTSPMTSLDGLSDGLSDRLSDCHE